MQQKTAYCNVNKALHAALTGQVYLIKRITLTHHCYLSVYTSMVTNCYNKQNPCVKIQYKAATLIFFKSYILFSSLPFIF